MLHFRLLFCSLLTLAIALRADEPFPRDLVEFKPFPENPVFKGEGAGHWDEKIRERGWILHENGEYRLWFTGYVNKVGSIRQLGYATSPDGIHWTRFAQNPLIPMRWIEDVMIVRDGETLYMFAEGLNDEAQLLLSKDGIHWTSLGKMDVRLSNGEPISPGPFGTPTAWKENDLWYFFYERRDLGVWVATSKDMKVWTNLTDEPVIKPGPEEYDARAVAMNQIIKHDGKYYASYHGHGKEGVGRWVSCLASSPDLRTWKKYSNNPLFPAEKNKSSAIYVPDGKGYRLYTMHDRVELHLPSEDGQPSEKRPE